jgi:hypothetical protein
VCRLGLVGEDDEDIDGLNLPFRENDEKSLAEQSESNIVDRSSSLNESSSSASNDVPTDGEQPATGDEQAVAGSEKRTASN